MAPGLLAGRGLRRVYTGTVRLGAHVAADLLGRCAQMCLFSCSPVPARGPPANTELVTAACSSLG